MIINERQREILIDRLQALVKGTRELDFLGNRDALIAESVLVLMQEMRELRDILSQVAR